MASPPQPPTGPSASQAPDPSMEDILASIRRILNEDEPAAAAPPKQPEPDDVLVLDASMMVDQPPQPPETMSQSIPPKPEPSAPAPTAKVAVASMPPSPSAKPPLQAPPLVAPEAAAGVASSLGSLVRTLSGERSTSVHRDGPTIEDLVREELRPLVKEWLDRHLPPIVERLVRVEIERVVGRTAE